MAVPAILRALNPVKSQSEYDLHTARTQNPLRSIPGFSGSDLGTQLDEQKNPLRDVDAMPATGTPEYQDALSKAVPVRANPLRNLGEAPSPPVWNPIKTDPQSGRPRISETAVGPTSEIQRKEYDALQRWNPREHEHKGNRLWSAVKSAGLAIKANPEYARDPLSLATLAATGAVRGGVSRATPDIYRRKIALRDTGEQLGQSMALDKESAQIAGINSQADAREQNLLLQAERNQRENEKMGQTERKMRNAMRVARGRELLSHLSGLREFNPDDPKNAAFVNAFTETFGYPPSRHMTGSLLDLREEYDAEGNLHMRVYDKGTATVTDVPIQPNTISKSQADRESRESEGKANRGSRELIAGNAEAGRNARAANALSVGPRGGLSKSQTKAANDLVRRYNNALAAEKLATEKLPPTDPTRAQKQVERENLWQQIFDTYPGVFEADNTGKVKMKSFAAPSDQVTGERKFKGRTISRRSLAAYASEQKISVKQAREFFEGQGASIGP